MRKRTYAGLAIAFQGAEGISVMQSVFGLILTLVIVAQLGCNNRHDRKADGSTEFITKKDPAGESPRSPTKSSAPPSEFLSPDPLTESTEPAPLLVQEQKDSEIPAYEMPEPIRERMKLDIPEFVPRRSEAFKVLNHNLNINQKTSTMTFSGVLQITGKQDEKFELSCKFDKAKDWACGNMFPTNPAVARERRLQAVANCADIYRCDRVGIELFVLVGGKIESQLFQSSKFEVRRSEAGDIPEFEPPAAKPDLPEFTPTPKNPPIRVYEKPRTDPVPVTPPNAPAPVSRPATGALTDEELRQLLDDPNVAVDIIAPMPVPRPDRGEFSIPEIEKLRPSMGQGVKNQAIGVHYNGRLEGAAGLPQRGAGFVVRSGRDRSFGTDSMIEVIQGAAAQMENKSPGQPPLVIADVAQKYGGRLSTRSGSYHASHQTGLDADIAFPSRVIEKDLWPACSRKGAGCPDGTVSDKLDEERLWNFMTAMVCAEKSPVIVIFVDTEIKRHMCRWASKRFDLKDSGSCAFKTLRALKYSPGHHDHMHVRLRCPGNSSCRDATVSLGRSTGC